MFDSQELVAEMYEHLSEVVSKSRKAEHGLRWDSEPGANAILSATRHVRSQVEPLVEYLERKLEEFDV